MNTQQSKDMLEKFTRKTRFAGMVNFTSKTNTGRALASIMSVEHGSKVSDMEFVSILEFLALIY